MDVHSPIHGNIATEHERSQNSEYRQLPRRNAGAFLDTLFHGLLFHLKGVGRPVLNGGHVHTRSAVSTVDIERPVGLVHIVVGKKAPEICPVLRMRLGIIRSTITNSRDKAGMMLPRSAVNLSPVMTML